MAQTITVLFVLQMMECIEQDVVMRMKDTSDVGQKSDDLSTCESDDGHAWGHRADSVDVDSRGLNVQHSDQFAMNGRDSTVTGQLWKRRKESFRINFCRAMLASSAALAVMRCLCVRPSRSWIVSKRINVSSKVFHLRVAKPF